MSCQASCSRCCLLDVTRSTIMASWASVSFLSAPLLVGFSKQRGSDTEQDSCSAIWLTAWQILVMVDLLQRGCINLAQSLWERLPATQAPATKALSTTDNSRRDVLVGCKCNPLYFPGFLQVIRSIFCNYLVVFDRVVGGCRMVRSDQEHLVGRLVRCITKNKPLRRVFEDMSLLRRSSESLH
jgi:hypothetical protein